MSFTTGYNQTTTNQSLGSAFRSQAQVTKTPGLKGALGAPMFAPRTQDCLFVVDAILRATSPEDAQDRVDQSLLYCEQLSQQTPEVAAEKFESPSSITLRQTPSAWWRRNEAPLLRAVRSPFRNSTNPPGIPPEGSAIPTAPRVLQGLLANPQGN